MNKRNRFRIPALHHQEEPPNEVPDVILNWDAPQCENFLTLRVGAQGRRRVSSSIHEGWAENVRTGIEELAAMASQKQKHEFRITLLEIVVNELKASVHRLQCSQTKLVAINTFAPEPYEVLKPIIVSIISVEGGFNACWFDANVHSSGENEEEAVSSVKSMILDFVDSFAKESEETLGPESKRQMAVIKQFVQKSA
jgi:hypothetical protein